MLWRSTWFQEKQIWFWPCGKFLHLSLAQISLSVKWGKKMVLFCFRNYYTVLNYYNNFTYIKILQLDNLSGGSNFQSCSLVRGRKPLSWCRSIHMAELGCIRNVISLKTLRKVISLGFLWDKACTACLAELKGISDIMRSQCEFYWVHPALWMQVIGQEDAGTAMAPLSPPGCCSKQPSGSLFTWHALRRTLGWWLI